MDSRKVNLAGEYGGYAMAEVGLAAIDLVTLNMDFDTGADRETVLSRLLPRVAAQHPGRPAAEHQRVARWVLESLINVGSVDRGFRAVYGTFGADGGYVRRDYDFKLIEEVPGPDGGVYLRTTDEAVNVLVGALDTDVTSAQIAAEVKLEVLIRRGRSPTPNSPPSRPATAPCSTPRRCAVPWRPPAATSAPSTGCRPFPT